MQRKSTCPECPEKEGIQTKPLAEQITPLVQRQVEEEEEVQSKLQRQAEEEEETAQTKASPGNTPEVTPNIESSINAMKGGGHSLSESTRSFFEPRFGVDFSQVRVHNDSKAAQTAQSINAKAFTTGKDIVFNSSQYSPETSSGKQLMAHELTHVVQQGRVPSLNMAQVQDSHQRNNAEPVMPIKSGTLQGEMIQADVLDALAGRFRDIVTDPLSAVNPIEQIFDSVVMTNRAMASRISIPQTWVRALKEYSADNLADGLVLIPALARFPSFFRGGWILGLQPRAGYMTLDHSIFVRGSLNLSKYIHEMVHVLQYKLLGVTAFLTSYFGMSAATIAYRWLRKLNTNPMRSNPHEEQAHNLEARFRRWYMLKHGIDPYSIVV
ncbi:MAG: DUF4157 domain-containing protein [Candidatus Aminicenantes bacterium]|nr:DUF4157 domain-containing protein [Candidatus Aminicenantes bacterium]NIM81867.1 DUF4157 domain-containing protein [Candidatus Aminicenantes bacterium]NIN21244.1 DUF4157 domain-containing protein [Candidatus Aminicenantes bacterium]NIN45065.1 DUF4157 domain-containing protein [Candidatus Aminicenantes bacterium]NIN87882.1 DUF4157 domain-containing protein [Candidatus Aminicenantes bacterium]